MDTQVDYVRGGTQKDTYTSSDVMPWPCPLCGSEKESEIKKIFFKDLLPEENNISLTGVKNIKGNFIIIESEKDQIIPQTVIEFFLKAAGKNGTHIVIKDADHQLSKGEWKQEFIHHLVDFFTTTSSTVTQNH
jgi:dipeptidyl aminopeptidase/acylaminoacyl peptidase